MTTYISDLAEVDETGDLTNYLSGNGKRLGTELDNTLTHNHQDYLESFAFSTTPDEAVSSVMEHLPFGAVRYEEGATPNHTFTDQIEDRSTGLMYYGARYYHPGIGRFTSEDPAILDNRLIKTLTDPQQLNPYTYARNNPLRFIDPTGQQATPFDVFDQASFDQSLQDFNNAEGTFEKVMTGIPLLADGAALAAPGIPAIVGNTGRAASRLGTMAREYLPEAVSGIKNMLGVGDEAMSGTKLLPQFSSSTIDKAVMKVMGEDNKLMHLFDNPEHNFGPLIKEYGGRENTVRAIFNGANGKIPTNGSFNDLPVHIGGHTVYIGGNVVDGVPRIGTAYIRK